MYYRGTLVPTDIISSARKYIRSLNMIYFHLSWQIWRSEDIAKLPIAVRQVGKHVFCYCSQFLHP